MSAPAMTSQPMNQELVKLAERVEGLTGPDREVAQALAAKVWDKHRKTAVMTFHTISDEAREILIACCLEGLAHHGSSGSAEMPDVPPEAPFPITATRAGAYLMTGTWELDPTGKHPGIYVDDPQGGDPICLCTIARIFREDRLHEALAHQQES